MVDIKNGVQWKQCQVYLYIPCINPAAVINQEQKKKQQKNIGKMICPTPSSMHTLSLNSIVFS